MEPDRWSRIEALFGRALELPPEAREALLRKTTEDPAVRAEVRSLLAVEREAQEFLRDLAARLGIPVAGVDPPDPRIGRVVGAYRLMDLLGEGGMGSVYRAVRTDGESEMEVAVKLLPHAAAPAARARFGEEKLLLALLEHPAVARLLDAGIAEDGSPYLVMELVEGEPITAHARRRGLDLRARVLLAREVVGAVAHAHERGIVHRDLKPSNVLVTERGRAKLLDFGIAKLLDGDSAGDGTLTRVGGRPLTPAYASPEQLWGGTVSPASDVYSLGILLHELLTGRRPYDTGSGWIPSAPLRTEPPPLPSEAVDSDPGAAPLPPSALRRALRGDLDALLLRCLEPDPGRRYASAVELADALDRYLEGRPVQGRLRARLRGAGRALRSRAPLLSAAALALVFLGMDRAGLSVTAAPSSSADTPEAVPRVRLPGGPQLVLFESLRSGNREIWAMSPDGGEAVNLTRHPAPDTEPAVSPDGRRIVFVSERGGNPDIYVMRTDGTGTRRLTHGWAKDTGPVWSPDGREIAFWSFRDGNPEIYVMAADGSDVRRLTDHPGYDSDPDWSPDGSWIAFRSDRDGTGDIWLMRPDGSEQRNLTRSELDEVGPDWSPDGRRIAFFAVGEEDNAVYVMGADGRDVRRLTGSARSASWPAWSPDGRWIAYHANDGRQVTGSHEVYVMRADGSEARNLSAHPALDAYATWMTPPAGPDRRPTPGPP